MNEFSPWSAWNQKIVVHAIWAQTNSLWRVTRWPWCDGEAESLPSQLKQHFCLTTGEFHRKWICKDSEDFNFEDGRQGIMRPGIGFRPKASSSLWSFCTFRRCSESRSAKTKSNGTGAGDWICRFHGPHHFSGGTFFLFYFFVLSGVLLGSSCFERICDSFVQAPSSRDADVALTPMLANLQLAWLAIQLSGWKKTCASCCEQMV